MNTTTTARLTIEWSQFSSIIKQKITTAEHIAGKQYSTKTQDDLIAIQQEIKNWSDACIEFLKISFSTENNRYVTDFRNARSNRYHLPNTKVNLPQLIKEEFEDLKSSTTELWEIERILSACDFVINKNEHLLAARQNYTTEEKIDFILAKLHDLYDQFYYPLRLLFEGNGVILSTHYEERELGTYLEQLGLLDLTSGADGIAGQLTTNGRLYVEEKRKKQREDYSDIKMSSQEMNEKLDSVIRELKKLGLGQEIIYNEFEELKDLYVSLNKKHWTQTLKGKLIDLGLSQVLDKDVLKEIYEQLTNHQFRLP